MVALQPRRVDAQPKASKAWTSCRSCEFLSWQGLQANSATTAEGLAQPLLGQGGKWGNCLQLQHLVTEDAVLLPGKQAGATLQDQ